MCMLLFEAIEKGNEGVLDDVRKVVKDRKFMPKSYKDLVKELFVTSYLGSKFSSKTTMQRAKQLSDDIGAHHFNMPIDQAYDAVNSIFTQTTSKTP